jgi:hypothetical protein
MPNLAALAGRRQVTAGALVNRPTRPRECNDLDQAPEYRARHGDERTCGQTSTDLIHVGISLWPRVLFAKVVWRCDICVSNPGKPFFQLSAAESRGDC